MFLKPGTGASKNVNFKAELAYGLSLGVAAGLTFKVQLRRFTKPVCLSALALDHHLH